jgi:hypothetical protein
MIGVGQVLKSQSLLLERDEEGA